MSNKRKLRTLTGSGFQRTPMTWRGRAGNRTAIAAAQKAEEESRHSRFIPRPKPPGRTTDTDRSLQGKRADRVIYDEAEYIGD